MMKFWFLSDGLGEIWNDAVLGFGVVLVNLHERFLSVFWKIWIMGLL